MNIVWIRKPEPNCRDASAGHTTLGHRARFQSPVVRRCMTEARA
jgi:hypothetical protein